MVFIMMSYADYQKYQAIKKPAGAMRQRVFYCRIFSENGGLTA
jgi:hypothetical protein